MRSIMNNSMLLSLLALFTVGTIVVALYTLRQPGDSTPAPTPPPVQDTSPPAMGDEIELTDRPQLVETPVIGVSKHAAAVGSPDGPHVVFDIDTCRLAIAWRGRFIDTDGNVLGEDQIEFAPGPAIAPLVDETAPWPHRNDEISGDVLYRRHTQSHTGRPTFEFELAETEVHVFETVSPRVVHELDGGGSGIQRRLVLKRPGGLGHVWFRAAVGDEIVETDDAFVIDNRVTIRFSRRMRGFGNPPVIRERSDGKFELLMPFFDPADDREQHEMLDVDVLW